MKNRQSYDKINYPLLADRTRHLKESSKGEKEMCKIVEEIVEEIVKEEKKEAQAEEKKLTALRMLKDNILPLEKIAEYVKLPLEEVRKLQAEGTK